MTGERSDAREGTGVTWQEAQLFHSADGVPFPCGTDVSLSIVSLNIKTDIFLL